MPSPLCCLKKIVFKSLHVFYKTLKDVERVKSTLAAYPNVAGYVRYVQNIVRACHI